VRIHIGPSRMTSSRIRVDEVLETHRAFWHTRGLAKPLLNVELEGRTHARRSLPRKLEPLKLPLKQGIATTGMPLEPWMLEPEKIHPIPEDTRESLDVPRTCGDVFQVLAPYYKIPWVEAIAGCSLVVKGDTIWSKPYVDRSKLGKERIEIARSQAWIDKLVDFTAYLVHGLFPGYLVTQTLMRGPTDLLNAIMGVENMCIGMYMFPQEMRDILSKLTDVLVEAASTQLKAIPKFDGGCCNPFGLWAPGTSVRTQDDAAVHLSPRMYEEFILPCEKRIVEPFDYTVRHVHSDCIRIVDMLLDMTDLSAIEITVDEFPYPRNLDALTPVLQKIQTRKPLIVSGVFTQNEFDHIAGALSPNGLLLDAEIKQG